MDVKLIYKVAFYAYAIVAILATLVMANTGSLYDMGIAFINGIFACNFYCVAYTKEGAFLWDSN